MNESVPPGSAASLGLDQVDLELLAVVQRRLAAAAAEQGAAPLRPARDVATLRKLIAAAGEGVEADFIVELWRVLIEAETRRLGPIDVAVSGGPDPVRMHDIARRHFGARTRIYRANDAAGALKRAVEEPNVVAVVPWPGPSGAGGWWPALSESKYHKLALVAALPMRGAKDADPDAAVFALNVRPEAAGDDITVALAFDQHHRAQRVLAEAGFAAKEVARSEPRVLYKISGFVAPDDVRVTALARGGLDGFRIVGSYARVS